MKFIKQTSHVFAYRVALVVVAFATDVILARALGPTGKGYVGVLVVTPVLLGVVATLGLDFALNYAGHREQHRTFGYFSTTSLMGLASAVVVAGLVAFDAAGTRSLLFEGIPEGMAAAVTIALIIVPAEVAFVLSGALAKTTGEPVLFGKMRLVRRTFILFAVGACVLSLPGGLDHVLPFIVAGYPIAIVIASFYCLSSLGYRGSAPQGRPLGLLKEGLAAFPGRVAERLQQRVDIVLLGILMSGSAVGIYTVAAGIGEMLFFLSSSASTVLFSRSIEDASRLHRAALRLIVPSGVATAVLVGAASVVVVPTIYGRAFSQAVQAVWFLLPGTVLMSGVHVATPYLVQRGRSSAVSVAQLIGVAGNVGLNLWLIPRFGVIGAALASSISYGLTFYVVVVAAAKVDDRSITDVVIPNQDDVSMVRRRLTQVLHAVRQ